MLSRIVLAAMVVAGLAAPPAALAQTKERGVTVFRGHAGVATYPNTAVPGTAASVTNGIAGGSTETDRSGAVNAVHTGSANAGEEITNPRPAPAVRS